MKLTTQDIFTAFYEAFHKLEHLQPGETPEEIEDAQKIVEIELKECSELLEQYVTMRVKKVARDVVKKMIYDGELK